MEVNQITRDSDDVNLSRNIIVLIGLGLVLSSITQNLMAYVPGIIVLFICALHYKEFIKQPRLVQFWKTHRFWVVSTSIAIALCLASVMWSTLPVLSIERLGKIIFLGIFGILFLYVFWWVLNFANYASLSLIIKIYMVSFLTALSLLCLLLLLTNFLPHLTEKTLGIIVSSLNKPTLIIFLCAIPAFFVMFMLKYYISLSISTFLVLASLALTASQASYLIVFGALITIVFGKLSKKILIPLNAVTWGSVFFFLPFGLVLYGAALLEVFDGLREYNFYASPFARFEIWYGASKLIFDEFWLGHGINTFRDTTLPISQNFLKTYTMLHPHNAPLQIWFEFGVVGIFFTICFLVGVFHKIYRIAGPQKIMLLAFINAYILQLMVSYGLWQGWNIGFLFFFSAYYRLSSLLIESNNIEEKNHF